MSAQHHRSSSSSLPSCFRPAATTNTLHDSLPPPLPGKPNLTTCLYHTHLGLFSLTWSSTFFGHSFQLNLHPSAHYSSPLSLPNSLSFSLLSFHLHIKPFLFWKKQGSKKLTATAVPNAYIFWDLSRAKFGSGPEPESGFYIAVVVNGEMTLLIGDSSKQAYSRTKSQRPEKNQVLLLKREHMFGNRIYSTRAKFGGKSREISIDCRVNEDAKLCFSIDNKRVLQIKRLKWKFRGNEKIEVDGVPIQVSWDVHNWLFDQKLNDGHAVFLFKFENSSPDEQEEEEEDRSFDEKNSVVLWQQYSSNIGMNPTEWKKMRRNSFLRSARSSSSSSISMSSASSGCSSSVLEWASAEETELSSPNGFSLLVYAWKK
ncbi:hypothetical protein SLE2022_034620 [Rubroshorea leprosula]